MKYVIIIPDGCADEPQEALGGKSPLEAARLPGMDRLAAEGVVGRASNVPAHLTPGSAVANMSLLGYDPAANFTGRAPLEAAAQGIELGDNDWAIRCNLVTIQDQVMRDFTADHISDAEARELLQTAQEALTTEQLEFVAGVSYRNLLLYRDGVTPAPFATTTTATPPHDLTDKSIINDYPRGPGSDLLNDLMAHSVDLFEDHPVNRQRRQEGKLPATNVWLWGVGQRPSLDPFVEKYGKTGSMITAVDLLRGLAGLIGWARVDVPGATGYTDTDYAAKGRYAIQALDNSDIVCVHVEATDEASHEGDTDAKITAVEQIDQHIVIPLREELVARGPWRMLVTPDHPTPIRLKTHSHGFIPFAIAGTNVVADAQQTYDERSAAAADLEFDPGWRLMEYFLSAECGVQSAE